MPGELTKLCRPKTLEHTGPPASRYSEVPSHLFRIRALRSTTDLEATARLFNAYASSLGISLGYQDFATELATLPGKYAPPAGALACDNHGEPLGCVGLRPIKPDGCCEMKRLYVVSLRSRMTSS